MEYKILLTTKQAEILDTFFNSDKQWIVCVGGKGSAKTTAIVFILINLMSNPEYANSKILVARESLRDLKNTLIEEFLRRSAEVGLKLGFAYDENKQLQRIYSHINNSEIFYLSLSERNEQYKTVRSYEFNVVVIDELDRISRQAFIEASERLRYRHKLIRGIVSLNPVPETHWIYQEFVSEGGNYTKLSQIIKSSLYDNFLYAKITKDFLRHAELYTFEGNTWYVVDNTRYEIVEEEGNFYIVKRFNLPHSYMVQMEHKPYIYRRVMVYGEWGNAYVDGGGIYSSYFSEKNIATDMNFNVSDLRFMYNFLAGLDFGVRRPAYVLLFEDAYGRLVVVDELIGENEPIVQFIENVAKRLREKFGLSLRDVEWWGDIAGRQREQFDGLSIIRKIEDTYKIKIHTIRTKQTESVEIIRELLEKQIKDVPIFRVHSSCHILLNGFMSEFRYDDAGKLLKDGYYEHLHDALRYVVYGWYKSNVIRSIKIKAPSY